MQILGNYYYCCSMTTEQLFASKKGRRGLVPGGYRASFHLLHSALGR